jgi:hypothetical protein
MSAFIERFTYPGPVEEFRDHVLYQVVAQKLASGDWALAQRDEGQASFERYDRSGWAYVACVLLFPIGLLALLAGKTRSFLTFRWTAIDTGTEIVVTGQAPGRMVKQIRAIDGARLQQQLAETRVPDRA